MPSPYRVDNPSPSNPRRDFESFQKAAEEANSRQIKVDDADSRYLEIRQGHHPGFLGRKFVQVRRHLHLDGRVQRRHGEMLELLKDAAKHAAIGLKTYENELARSNLRTGAQNFTGEAVKAFIERVVTADKDQFNPDDGQLNSIRAFLDSEDQSFDAARDNPDIRPFLYKHVLERDKGLKDWEFMFAAQDALDTTQPDEFEDAFKAIQKKYVGRPDGRDTERKTSLDTRTVSSFRNAAADKRDVLFSAKEKIREQLGGESYQNFLDALIALTEQQNLIDITEFVNQHKNADVDGLLVFHAIGIRYPDIASGKVALSEDTEIEAKIMEILKKKSDELKHLFSVDKFAGDLANEGIDYSLCVDVIETCYPEVVAGKAELTDDDKPAVRKLAALGPERIATNQQSYEKLVQQLEQEGFDEQEVIGATFALYEREPIGAVEYTGDMAKHIKNRLEFAKLKTGLQQAGRVESLVDAVLLRLAPGADKGGITLTPALREEIMAAPDDDMTALRNFCKIRTPRPSITQILKNPIIASHFGQYLHRNGHGENYDFLVEAIAISKIENDDKVVFTQRLNKLYDRFMKEGSPEQINLDTDIYNYFHTDGNSNHEFLQKSIDEFKFLLEAEAVRKFLNSIPDTYGF